MYEMYLGIKLRFHACLLFVVACCKMNFSESNCFFNSGAIFIIFPLLCRFNSVGGVISDVVSISVRPSDRVLED